MIEKMKYVCIVAQHSRKENLLQTLRELGIMHIAERKAADAVFLERFAKLSKISLELKEYSDASDTSDEILSDEQFEKMYQSSISALERKAYLTDKKAELLFQAEALKPWGDFDPQAVNELSEMLNLHFYRLEKKDCRLLSEDKNIQFIRLAPVGKMEAVAVIGKLGDSVSAIEFSIPEKGSAELKDELKQCEEELSRCERILKDSARHLKSYSEQLLKAQNASECSSAEETLRQDGDLVWISGYIPEADEDTFLHIAKKQSWAWIINDVDENDSNIPTKIRYGKLTALMKPIFDILGIVPGYNEYDISFWFLGFFALFFAMIIGDAGYGALFLAGTVALNVTTKKATNLTWLLYLLSVSTIIWGALTGTWFGLEGAMKIPFFKALVIPGIANYPQYFSVETSAVQNNVMKFCFSLGVIQLALACIMNIRRKSACKNLSWLSDVGWLLSICALYFLVLNLVIGEKINLGIVGAVIGAGFLMVIFFGGMAPDKTFAAGLKAGLGDAFTVFLNTISAFGNVMSYIRLFAVGMASLAIAQSFNNMAAGFEGPAVIAGIVIMAIGHLLNIVMGFLSVVVHGIRLNLLEFSGQLGMEWSGVSYEPFRDIKKLK